MKGIRRSVYFFILMVCAVSIRAQANQIKVPRIELMPNQPSPYNMLNWKRVAQQYDSFIYNINQSGQYLPLVSIGAQGINYPLNKTIRMHSYVGTNSPNGSEGINVLPSLVSASLNGIDKTNQYGQDWLTMSQDFFNKANGENIYLNNAGAGSGSDWWYDVMPNVFFYQLYDLYPNRSSETKNQFTIIADRFLASVKAMHASDTPWNIPNMNYRAWNFKTMQGNANGVHEPEASGGYAWILYNAYMQTGNKNYLEGAEWAIEFLNNYPSSPSYELQLPYGTSIAAKMNAELGNTYDIGKMINWSFDRGPLRNWGTIVGKWGAFDVSGLVGEANDAGNDYAFQLNGVQQAGALLPMVRYDKRFARAIGKWILNLANATRLFYPGYLPASMQDAATWSDQYDPNHVIGYEALRERLNGLSPVSTGDALKGGWAGTNLSLYSTSSIGYLGAIVETTSVPQILKLDLLKTDFFHGQAYPSFLFYNPYTSSQTIQFDAGKTTSDLYDVLTETFVAKNVTGPQAINIPADQAVLIVLVPANATITYNQHKLLFNNVVVDYNQSKQAYIKSIRIKALAAKNTLLQVNDSTAVYTTADNPGNRILNYSWSASSGKVTGKGPVVQWHAPFTEGKATIKIILIDDLGTQDSAILDVSTVNKINLAPQIANIDKTANYTGTGGLLQLKSIASDPNGDSLTYSWAATGGVFNDASSRSVIWTAPSTEGIYTITSKVSDSDNLTDQMTTSILVKNFSNSIGKLIAYYPFNNNADDLSGNQLHGDPSGIVYVPDRNSTPLSACYFNGGAQRISVNNDAKLNVQDAITVSCWFNAARLPDKETFLLSHGSWQNRWKLSITPEKRLRWTINSLTTIVDLDSPNTFAVDSFYHIAASYDGSFMTLYLNGNLIAFKALSGKIRTTALPFLMGQMLPDITDYNFKGILDEVKLFDYALSPITANALYQVSSTAVRNSPHELIHSLTVYPNPSSGWITINSPAIRSASVWVSIRDVRGTLVYRTLLKSTTEPIDVSLLVPGVYLINVSTSFNTSIAKFIKL